MVLFMPEEGKPETSCGNKEELRVFGFHSMVMYGRVYSKTVVWWVWNSHV